jgi:hypothetical protein
MRLAAVTMVYNEAEYLPVWLRHYAAAVGAAHCHIVDHGSTDGSTDNLGAANRLRLPRSPHDDARRARFISTYCAALLTWYDAIIHTDVDELVVPDPRRFASLPACAEAAPEVASAIGFNLLHLPAEEPPLDFSHPIGPQRHWAWFTSAMCKPVLIRRPVTWSPGFHSADAPLAFHNLYLIHLRYADRATAFARLARTRAMPWATLDAGAHQRVTDADFTAMLDRLERMPKRDGDAFNPTQPPLAPLLNSLADHAAQRAHETFRIPLDLDNFELWRVPALRLG